MQFTNYSHILQTLVKLSLNQPVKSIYESSGIRFIVSILRWQGADSTVFTVSPLLN